MTREWVKGYGPPCPACGHIRSTRIGNGWSEPSDHYLRYKRCEGCAGKFVTVEALVPDTTTFYRLDYHGRELRRERWRRTYGKTGRWLKGKLERSDRLKVTVSVKPSSDFAVTHCFRGHEFTAENTYVNPGTHHRRCIACREITAHSYYLKYRKPA